MNGQTDSQLLRAYAEHRSEPAFAELVSRHVDFVYSAALRMVCDSHLAQDVTQCVFLALAKNADQLTDRPVLSGWLHRTAQNIAAQTVRSDVRRRAREQAAAAMNELHEPDAAWEQIAPHLDSALGELSEADRDALLLRYFHRKSAREMAQTLGTSEVAAQKRVSRAVERLREFLAKRGVTVGASGLVVVISAKAVQSAPVGLAVTISTAATVAGTTLATTSIATATQAIAMTTLQKTVIAVTLAAAVGTGIYEARQASTLRSQVRSFQQQQAPLAEQVQQLQRERDDATNRLASLADEVARLKNNSTELLRLRGEVGVLRSKLAEAGDMKTQSTAAATQAIDPAESPTTLSAKVDRLKHALEQMPYLKIPELQLCTEEDWLNSAAGKLTTDDEYRRAFQQLRARAQSRFAGMTSAALEKYMRANAGQFPSALSQLQPFFKSPVEEAIVQRYEIVAANLNRSLTLRGFARFLTLESKNLKTLSDFAAGGY